METRTDTFNSRGRCDPSRHGSFRIKLATAVLWLATASLANGAGKLNELLDLKPGEWRQLPDTSMSEVFPQKEETTWGIVGPASVVIAWGGAAYDTKRNAFVFNGGGHADYGGNEVYAFFLEELKWRRLTDPSPVKEVKPQVYVTTDDTPLSAHTYDSLEYLPSVDRVFRNGGSEWRHGGNADKSAWLFDMAEKRWERKSAGGGGFPAAAYDPVREVVYVVGYTFVDEYDPAKDKWTRRVSNQAYYHAEMAALDPVNRKIVTNSFKPGVIAYSIAADGSLSQRLFVEPKGAAEWSKAMAALEYDPVRKVMVAWRGARETAYLDLKTMTWRRFKNEKSAAAPVRTRKLDFPASGKIYGRWRYVPEYDVFIGYNSPRRNVWVWKPAAVADGDDSPPPPSPPSSSKG